MRSAILRTARPRLAHGPVSKTARPGWASCQHGGRRAFTATAVARHEERKWSTPLAKQLTEAINTTGPIPLASFMRMCLTSDTGGYYTGALGDGRDPFGKTGDFITSPEISQVFGELVGIWFVAEWISQGKPRGGVELLEVGPGRGTLMDDMLRTIKNFPDMVSAIGTIYMVEASPELRTAQKNLLCGQDALLTESKVGWHSTSKYASLPIVWTDTIQAVPREGNKTPFIVAHEFFDALPIHAFQVVDVPHSPNKTAPSPATQAQVQGQASRDATSTKQWREMVISPAPLGSTHDSLGTPKSERHDGPVPEFQLTLSPSATRHSMYVPETSPRYRALKSIPNALIEVCPDSYLYAAEFASRIGGSKHHPKERPSGAALILDYGPSDTIPVNSLRGIKAHKRVSPFSEPGLVDLSADVDFLAIAEASMIASEGIEVHGPVTQADFLEAMGIQQRAEHLAKRVADPARKQEIERSMKRLVDRGPGGMGKLYKALAILPENSGRRRPTGFGGDVGA